MLVMVFNLSMVSQWRRTPATLDGAGRPIWPWPLETWPIRAAIGSWPIQDLVHMGPRFFTHV